MELYEIFFEVDEFCKVFYRWLNKNSLGIGKQKSSRYSMSLSEIMTILIGFHLSRYRSFKDYYLRHVAVILKPYFPRLVSYNRFIELMPAAGIALAIFLKKYKLGNVTGISFVDSTLLRVCHNLRINRNRVFKGKAARGKTSTGWFYGFKLHLIINDRGEIIAFDITPGNCDDRNLKMMNKLTAGLFGKLFGDKGYISSKLTDNLAAKGIQLITNVKGNMKNKLVPLMDKLLLRKRWIIETINDQLKNLCQIDHSRHRSPLNFLVNLLSGLVAYCYFPKKPSLNLGKAKCLFA